MKAPAAATDSPEPPLNNAHANFAPNDPPGEWRSQARDYANTRYSPLDQITAANVAKLRVAWSFSDGTPNGHEAAPLVVGDTMYIVTPFPNLAYALDLSKAGVPIKWSYDPKPTPLAIGKACCDTVNRGSVYADGKLIYNLLDDHTDRHRREDRQGSLAHEDGRRDHRHDDDDGALRRRRQGLRRQQRRRARRMGLARGARRQDRQGALARAQQRHRQGRT